MWHEEYNIATNDSQDYIQTYDVDIYYLIHFFINKDGSITYFISWRDFIKNGLKTPFKPSLYINKKVDEYVHAGKRHAAFCHNNIVFGDYDGFINSVDSHYRMKYSERFKKYYRWSYCKESYTNIAYVENNQNIPYYIDIISKKSQEILYNISKNLYYYPWNSWLTKEERIQLSNRWKTEQLLADIIKEKYKVVQQWHPEFLKSDKNGQLYCDIYIPDLNMVVEYQGEQHFKPVDFFGGEDAYKRRVILDKTKYDILKQHQISILYFDYTEDINASYVFEKINNFNNNNNKR